jgi:hypothetical protein
MTKRLVDISDQALESARAALGTRTMKETVNRALELASGGQLDRVDGALNALAAMPAFARGEAWR